jgi:hypothetical protein
MKASPEIQQFIQDTLYLDNPEEEDIGRAYLRLSPRGRINVTCTLASVGETASRVENAGFFGLELTFPVGSKAMARLSAFKGKEGACYDTGRTAEYRGAAAAVLDDDGHLMAGRTPISVCEKTALIYTLPGYRDFIFVSRPDEGLYRRLASDPKSFDCDNFEVDAESLVKRLEAPTGSIQDPVPVVYPGPFRIMILTDGSMLRRAEPVLLSSGQARLIEASGEGIILKGAEFVSGGLSVARNFVSSYKEKGPLCLLEGWSVKDPAPRGRAVDYRVLGKITRVTGRRIRRLIDERQSYFILMGSDPRDIHGCCPSDEVGSANRLVEAGILQFLSWHTPPGTCPTTIYAFAGEIEEKSGSPNFSINEELRIHVKRHLKASRRWKTAIVKNILRVALLLFVGLSVGYYFWQRQRISADAAGLGTLNPSSVKNGVAVYFFHTSVRCDPCLNMEAFTKRTLRDHFSEEVSNGAVDYAQINIDDPRYRHLITRYSIFTSTVVLVRFVDGLEKDFRSLTPQVWQLYNSEQEFISMLNSELVRFMDGVDE